MKHNITDPDLFKKRVLSAAEFYGTYCFMDSHKSKNNLNWIAGFGQINNYCAEYNSFYELSNFFLVNRGKYVFGHLNYDLKNQIENLVSEKPDFHEFQLFNFFTPAVTIVANGNTAEIIIDDQATSAIRNWVSELIQANESGKVASKYNAELISNKVELLSRTGKEKYMANCKKIKEHIQMGDIYEMNYCMEFFDDDATIHPVFIYQKLADLTEAPMSCLYRNGNSYLMCASPERFMKRIVDQLISQPIKGTKRRSLVNPIVGDENDDELKSKLFNDEKERAENVMIVDLVRNDLSRIAEKGSVTVDELFGIYTFKTVHQMISTISCRVRKEVTFTEILKALFPMGSMTGAPKIRAMQLIEKYEDSKRGLFSGSVGYIKPDGDFDFNVVIRSIFYNKAKHYLSTWAGSAITINSEPEKEYEECMLKLQAMIKALEN